eukprot:3600667-Pyramimonas_sp.AAC.1
MTTLTRVTFMSHHPTDDCLLSDAYVTGGIARAVRPPRERQDVPQVHDGRHSTEGAAGGLSVAPVLGDHRGRGARALA